MGLPCDWMLYTRIIRRTTAVTAAMVVMIVLASTTTIRAEAASAAPGDGGSLARVVGIAGTPDGGGYWLTDILGEVIPNGGARFLGSMQNQPLNSPIAHIVAAPELAKSANQGYWLL